MYSSKVSLPTVTVLPVRVKVVMIYVDGSGNEGYVNGNDFVLADGSTLPVNHQQRTDGAGHDLYIDREGHEGYIADGLFTYERRGKGRASGRRASR